MFEESAAWGVSESSTGDIVQDTIKKEKLVQCVSELLLRAIDNTDQCLSETCWPPWEIWEVSNGSKRVEVCANLSYSIIRKSADCPRGYR